MHQLDLSKEEEINAQKFKIIRVGKPYTLKGAEPLPIISVYILKDQWTQKDFTQYFNIYAGRLEEWLRTNKKIDMSDSIDLFYVFDRFDYVVLDVKVFSKEVIGEF